jgi:hypothetical protein
MTSFGQYETLLTATKFPPAEDANAYQSRHSG